MNQYRIVSEWDITDLQEEVCLRLSEGWVCQGGVSVAAVEDYSDRALFRYSQAMVK